jgi:endoglucanase
VQFRLSFPGAHDPTKDWSYQGVSTTPGSTPVTVNDMVLYDGSTAVWGQAPSGDGSTTPPDTTPPGAPGKPTASSVADSSVTLTWPAATAGSLPLAGYQVYAGSTLLATTTATTWTATGLTPGTAYTFTVKAVDTAGNTSSASPAVTVTTTTTTTPPGGGTGAACTAVYKVTNSWSGGFQADVLVTNTGSAALNGWTLTFTFGGDQQVGSGWSGTFTQSGKKVTVTNPSWAPTLAAGGTVDPGFTATYSSSNAAPTGFALNGVACT